MRYEYYNSPSRYSRTGDTITRKVPMLNRWVYSYDDYLDVRWERQKWLINKGLYRKRHYHGNRNKNKKF